MDVFETLTKTISEKGQAVAEKAKIAKDIIKVKDQIRATKKQMRILTYKIGQAYLELHEEDCEGEFVDLVRGVKEAKVSMEEKKDILAELVSQLKFGDFENFDDFEADLEDLFEEDSEEEVMETAAEEVVEETTEAVEEMSEETAEAIEETAEVVEEAIEEIAEAAEDSVVTDDVVTEE
ncbi:MAG: hypothetical protein Q4E53_09990 [Eubacteriales bacterium]|nr:hypothetical protein [Eubacteriales bacterium]